MKTPYISSFFYFLLATALMPISSLNVNAQEEPGDKESTENQEKTEPKKEEDCSKQDSGKSRMSLSSSFASISGGFSTLAPDQATPSFVGLHASNVGAPVESKTRSATPVLNFPGGISAFYATPQSLTPFGKGSEVLRSEEGWVRQVRSATGFLNVEETPNGYAITSYSVAAIPAVKNAEGFYNIPTGLTPLSKRTVTVLNGGNKIKIEETTWYGKAPRTETVLMEQTPGKTNGTALLTQTWSNHNGVYKVAKTELTLPSSTLKARSAVPEPPVESYTNVVEEMGTDGVMYVVKRTAGTRTTYRWDDGPVPLSECNAVDESGNPLPESTTTTYTYYTDSTDRSSYGRPSTMRKTDGYWENYEYSDNNMGGIRTVKTLSPWMNTPAPALGEQPTGAHRVKQEVILKTDTGTSGLTVTVNGIPIEKYWIDSVNSGENTVIDTKHQPHSGGDKITVTKRYCRDKTKVDEALMGKPLLIKNADGSLEVYTYQTEGNTLITTCDSGYGTESSVSKGIRTISKTDKTTKKLKEEIRYALQDGAAYWLSSKTGVDFDPVGNCLKWIYNNNPEDYSEQRRDCCEINWERARDGIETTYARDASGKLISETSRGKMIIYEKKGLTTITRRQEVGGTKSFLVSEEIRNMAGKIISNKVPTLEGRVLITSYRYNIPERATSTVTPFGTTIEEIKFADKQLKTEKGTTNLAVEYTYTPTLENGGGVLLNAVEGEREETVQIDLLENILKIKLNSGSVTSNVYDSSGKCIKTILPDGECLIYLNDGDIKISGIDLDGDGVLNVNSDRMKKEEKSFDVSWPEEKGSWKMVNSKSLHGNWIADSIKWQTEDGTLRRTKDLGVSEYTIERHPAIEKRGSNYIVSIVTPAGQTQRTEYILESGIITSVNISQLDSNNQIFSSRVNTKNVWGQLVKQTNAKTGDTTNYSYDDATGTLLSVKSPDNSTELFEYDDFGRITTKTLADGTKQYTTYNTEGNITKTWGSQLYPVNYEYNAHGKLTAMVTYRSPSTSNDEFPEEVEGDRTIWIYDDVTGYLTEKKYATGNGVSYTYTLGGKLKTTKNSRGNTTTRNYNSAAQLSSVYVDDQGITPNQNFTYNQLGRVISAQTDGVISYDYIYDINNHLFREKINFISENEKIERIIERSYDSFGRNSGYKLKHGDFVEHEIKYLYNAIGKISKITADESEFEYEYAIDNPNLISQIISPIHTVNNVYKNNSMMLINKINRWKNKTEKSVISSYSYTVNNIDQRLALTADGEILAGKDVNWIWEYDSCGQITKANNDVYVYDKIGNRKVVNKGGFQEQQYTTNNLNQYTSIDGNLLHYDLDGNLLSGLNSTEAVPERSEFVFSYNANNRIAKVKHGSIEKEIYEYDHLGRKVKNSSSLNVYDGHNLIASYSVGNGRLNSIYSWGIDISGMLQGGGGVGGLLAVTDLKTQMKNISFPLYDGNGNITEYIKQDEGGMIDACYRYDAFGRVIYHTGNNNYLHLFSTKCFSKTTELVEYEQREYDPVIGRWNYRDAIGEKGGINLYSMCKNDCINNYDYLGFSSEGECKENQVEIYGVEISKKSSTHNIFDNTKDVTDCLKFLNKFLHDVCPGKATDLVGMYTEPAINATINGVQNVADTIDKNAVFHEFTVKIKAKCCECKESGGFLGFGAKSKWQWVKKVLGPLPGPKSNNAGGGYYADELPQVISNFIFQSSQDACTKGAEQ